MFLHLTISILLRMAGKLYFSRGEDYFNRGHVASLSEKNGKVVARVKGTRIYAVHLWDDKDEIGFSCNCPAGEGGDFCKHCVAAGLAWLEKENSMENKARHNIKQQTVTIENVKKYLRGLDKDKLVNVILEQADKDDLLREQLFARVASLNPEKPKLGTFKTLLRDAILPDHFIGYRQMWEYESRVNNVLDAVEKLLKEGIAVSVIEIVEYALPLVEQAIQSVDDSDGQMGGILARLQELHVEACRKARPDSQELAKRLFQMELNSEWDAFYGAAKTYASVIGKKGLETYRKLAEAEWQKVPVLRYGQDNSERYGKRFRITHIMETLAHMTGDIEELVAVKSRDLSSAYNFLEIAELYKKASNHDKVLEWAEAGVKAFPVKTDSRLRDFLADEYHRRKQHGEAIDLIWAEYNDWTRLDNYKKLKMHSIRINKWPEWRDKALSLLRSKIAASKKEKRNNYGWGHRMDNSALVEIFLWEKDVDAAWKEAQEGLCSEHLWRELATARENNHPEDAIVVYKKLIEPIINQKNNAAYDEAYKILRKIQTLMNKIGQQDAFAIYLENIIMAHKQKRNFMKLVVRLK